MLLYMDLSNMTVISLETNVVGNYITVPNHPPWNFFLEFNFHAIFSFSPYKFWHIRKTRVEFHPTRLVATTIFLPDDCSSKFNTLIAQKAWCSSYIGRWQAFPTRQKWDIPIGVLYVTLYARKDHPVFSSNLFEMSRPLFLRFFYAHD